MHRVLLYLCVFAHAVPLARNAFPHTIPVEYSYFSLHIQLKYDLFGKRFPDSTEELSLSTSVQCTVRTLEVLLLAIFLQLLMRGLSPHWIRHSLKGHHRV